MLRATGSGSLSALLVLAPLVILPIFAVVGIPQFAGGNLIDSKQSSGGSGPRPGRSAPETRLGEAAQPDADDLFAPLDDTAGFDDPLQRPKKKTRPRNSRESSNFESNMDDVGIENDTFDNGEGHRGSSRRRGRPAKNSVGGDDQFDADSSDVALEPDAVDASAARGERYADSGEDFSDSQNPTQSRGSSSKRRFESSQDFGADEQAGDSPSLRDDKHLFEPSAPASSNPAKGSRNTIRSQGTSRPSASKTKPRGPNDAPLFRPDSDADNSADTNDAELNEPSSPAPSARKAAPKSQSQDNFSDQGPESGDARDSGSAKSKSSLAASAQQEHTLKNLFDKLQAVGMTPESHYFTYMEDTESFLFTCTATRPGATNPQKFEEEANEPVLAVLKVLKRVQSWQAKTPKKTRPI